MAFESVVQALHPIRVVVWGEQAIGFHGLGTLLNSYMLIPSEPDFDLAAQKLVDAGFRPAPWSYGVIDPSLLRSDEISRRIDPMQIPGYQTLDANSLRFQFPAGVPDLERVVLLRSAYIGLSPPSDPSSLQRYSCQKNICYPDKTLLLESFIRTLLKDSDGYWRNSLGTWAISYIYGAMMLDETVLDSCDDEGVRLWFNEHIYRGKGGLDRGVTKRLGKGQPPPK
ncbi:MAG: hypothetical protein M1829_001680 [Trizodia sp. TS-e1964]|nr:MAG: hypothetical protein M1829_001680 [Trizodia sp. TS-e1964]